MVDALGLGPSAFGRGGSSPFTRTIQLLNLVIFTMKINLISEGSFSPSEKIFELVIEDSDFRYIWEEKILDYKSRIKVKGFREGKATKEQTKQLYGNDILKDTLSQVASDGLSEAIGKECLYVVGKPIWLETLSPKPNWEKSQSYKCRFKVFHIPPVEIDFSALKIKRYKVEKLTEKETNELLVQLQRKSSKVKEVEFVSLPAIIHGNFICEELKLNESSVVFLESEEIETSLLKKELSTILLNKKKGDKVFLDERFISSEAGFLNLSQKLLKQLSEKKVNNNIFFQITRLAKIITPKLDKEFMEKVSGESVEDLSSFKKKIVSHRNKVDQARADFITWKEIKKNLINNCIFNLPEDHIRRQIQAENSTEEVSKNAYDSSIERVKENMLLAQLLSKYKVTVSEQEVADRIAAYMRQVKDHYGDNMSKKKLLDDTNKWISSPEHYQTIERGVREKKMVPLLLKDFFSDEIQLSSSRFYEILENERLNEERGNIKNFPPA